MKFDAILSKVRMADGKRLTGLIYEDKLTRFDDGDTIVTSPVIETHYEDGEVRYVKTETGVTYMIGSWVHAMDL